MRHPEVCGRDSIFDIVCYGMVWYGILWYIRVLYYTISHPIKNTFTELRSSGKKKIV